MSGPRMELTTTAVEGGSLPAQKNDPNPLFLFAGFVNSRRFKLVNTSLIPMTFSLRVPADGGARDMVSNEYTDSLIDSNITDSGSTVMSLPKEFDITPCAGTIVPQDEMDINVSKVLRTQCL